jgi:hypothetical protein
LQPSEADKVACPAQQGRRACRAFISSRIYFKVLPRIGL